MKILLVTNSCDHGTNSIAAAYKNKVNAWKIIETQKGLKQLGFGGIIKYGMELRRASKEADTILSINYAALCISAIFCAKNKKSRLVAITDWTGGFYPHRSAAYRWVYKALFKILASRFDAIYCPVDSFRELNSGVIDMKPTLYPLPYPISFITRKYAENLSEPVFLYIGADLKRKGGDLLLAEWEKHPPQNSSLNFVSPQFRPESSHPEIIHHRDIRANTSAHRELFEKSDIFILPTHGDAFGFVILEALNFGLVVITTKAAGCHPLVTAAGGIVADTPQECVSQAFALASKPAELLERQKKVREYILQYDSDFDSGLKRILNIKSM